MKVGPRRGSARTPAVRFRVDLLLVGAPRVSALPNAELLTITVDSGGTNGPRVRLWRFQFGRLADRIGIPIRVFHYPPGTSKWNRSEHRRFSYIVLSRRRGYVGEHALRPSRAAISARRAFSLLTFAASES